MSGKQMWAALNKETYEVTIADEALDVFAQRLFEALPYTLKEVDRVGERVYGISELSPVWVTDAPPARIFALAGMKAYATNVVLKLDLVGSKAGDLDRWVQLIESLDFWLSKRYGVALLVTEDASSADDNEIPAAAEEATGDAQPTVNKKRWRPRSEADRWFISQFFDVYQEKRALYLFRDEWLQRKKREKSDFDPPVPSNNLYQLIKKERKERERENLQ